MRPLLCLLPLLFAFTDDQTTTTVGKAYIEEVMVKRDFEAAQFLTKKNMFFVDPTAKSMGMPVSQGIRGQAQIIQAMKGFNLGQVVMQAKHQFTAGPYHCFVGSFSSQPPKTPAPRIIPFMTVLKVEDAKIIERTDYGDYDAYLPLERRIDGVVKDQEHPMVQDAKAYVEAYAKRDFEGMLELRAEQSIFQDRTAVRLGSGAAIKGKQGVDRMLRAVLSNNIEFDIKTDFSFFHDDFAVFAGQVSYTLPGKLLQLKSESFAISHSIAIVLQFKEGKIIRHDDFCDYETFVNALAAAKAKEG